MGPSRERRFRIGVAVSSGPGLPSWWRGVAVRRAFGSHLESSPHHGLWGSWAVIASLWLGIKIPKHPVLTKNNRLCLKQAKMGLSDELGKMTQAAGPGVSKKVAKTHVKAE